MRHRNKGVLLGREKGPRQALLRNLATSVVLYEKVKTTQAKAKAIKPIVERAVTASRKDTLHTRRRLLQYFLDEKAVKKLLEDLGPRDKTRPGGYMRITKLAKRHGDAAPIVQIEFV
ncbi:MAG: 50S ribosomal protein L17 [Parcubacteria group bacterium]|nr:50S ribosomal protein L17 [Parcubacteria group bacterium]